MIYFSIKYLGFTPIYIHLVPVALERFKKGTKKKTWKVCPSQLIAGFVSYMDFSCEQSVVKSSPGEGRKEATGWSMDRIMSLTHPSGTRHPMD